jgi:CRP-like cAMP-binding protein
VVGGLALQVERSIQVGDWIRLKDNREGKVAQVRWRHTTLETREGDTLVVPNITLLQETFILLGRKNGRSGPRRVVVQFHVDFRTSPSLVCQTVRDCLTSSPIPNVAKEPCLDVICLDLGRELRESMAIYQARYWLTDVALEDPTSSIVRSRVATALKRAGIPLARPSFTNFMMDSQEDDAHARTTRRQALALSLLSSLELFQLLTNEEQRHLADRLVFSPFDTGEVITRQGAVAHYLYIIQSGSVDVVTEVNGVQRTVRTLKAPDLFGEMGLMTGEPRMASVVALNPVTCFRLDKTAFDAILHARPSLAEAMAALLAKRRVELLEVRKELDSIPREQQEREKILSRIQSFFGLDN